MLNTLAALFRHHPGYMLGRCPPSLLEEFEQQERRKTVVEDFESWRMQPSLPIGWLTKSVAAAFVALVLWGFVTLFVGEQPSEPPGTIVAERTDR